MRLLRRLARAFVGDELEPPFGALLTGQGFTIGAAYMFSLFYGIWMLNVLGASARFVGISYGVAGACSAISGVFGGRLSDHFGRRAILTTSALIQGSAALILLPSHPPITVVAGAQAVMSIASGARAAATNAAIGDLTTSDKQRIHYFAANRVVFNFGATGAPIIGSLLLLIGWRTLHIGIVLMYLVVLVTRLRLPKLPAPVADPARPSAVAGSKLLAPFRDGRLRIFALAAALTSMTYGAFELIFPLALTRDHGYRPALWGVIFTANPIVVILLQLRISRWAATLRRAFVLVGGTLAMALPFLVLSVSAAVPVVFAIVAVFTIGEMLVWPMLDTLSISIAPPESRGAYQGAANLGMPIAQNLLPAVALLLNSRVSESAMWGFIALLGVTAASLLIATDRAAQGAEADRATSVAAPVGA